MSSTKLAALLAIAVVQAAAPPAAFGCGDKFLVVCRGVEAQRAGAVHPVSILILRDASASPDVGVSDPALEKKLRQAGHTVGIVKDRDSLAAQIDAGNVDLVLAELSAADEIRKLIARSDEEVVLVPLMYKPGRSEYRAARAQYAFVVRTPGSGPQLLATIDDAVRARG